MDRLYSYNWLKEHTGLKISADDFAKKFSLHSMSVERVTRITPKFSGVITVKILKIEPHPNADKLRLATVTNGKSEQTVVCGAPNIEVGQTVPLAQSGANVVDSKNPAGGMFTVGRAEIRGVESNGMLCSLKELGLSDDHAGIWILPNDTPLGMPLENLLDLPDSQLLIEVTSNRPDAMSAVGLAREAAAIFGKKGKVIAAAKSKIQRKTRSRVVVWNDKRLSVKVLDKKFCPRYQAVVINDIVVGPSPLWLQMRLLRSGIRPINNIVDITNYVLLEYGQPMHAFDYDKLQRHTLVVRKARIHEKILALDGKTYGLNPKQTVIADGKRAVAIAGVMGGQDSAVMPTTKTIVFEAATFNAVAVRRTARDLNLHSESSSLFEKGLHPEALPAALERAVALAQEIAGGHVASAIADIRTAKFVPTTITLGRDTVERYFGFALPPIKIRSMLSGLGFAVKGARALRVTAPWWRADVTAEHDLIEELSRLYGYDALPKRLPSGALPAQAPDPILDGERRMKRLLQTMRFTELYTYSFISEKQLTGIGRRPEECIKIANVLSADHEYMRPSLLAGLLQAAADNQAQPLPLHLFELSNIYTVRSAKTLPDERSTLGMAVMTGTPEAFLELKGAILQVLSTLGLSDISLRPIDANQIIFDRKHALDIYVDGRTYIGSFGLITSTTSKTWGIDHPLAIAELDFAAMISLARPAMRYTSVPAFPVVERDLSLLLDGETSWQTIASELHQAHPLLTDVEYVATYTGKGIAVGKKSVTARLTFRSNERTLTTQEVDQALEKIIGGLQTRFGAEVR